MKKMTKREALRKFREMTDNRDYHPAGNGDLTAKREAWDEYTDRLYNDRLITEKQFREWDNPFA